MSAQEQARSRGSVMLARVFWLFIGPLTLGFLAYSIGSSGTGWATWLDAAFLIVASSTLFARWFELHSGEGRDGYGAPATLAAFPKYAEWVIPTALGVWAVANLLGNHVFKES